MPFIAKGTVRGSAAEPRNWPSGLDAEGIAGLGCVKVVVGT